MKAVNIVLAVAVIAVAVGAAVWVRTPQPSTDAVAVGKDYTVASSKMMSAMMGGQNVAYTGNSDGDFAALMIPHLQGAVDMAAVAAEYGADGRLKAIAQKIAAAQQAPIEQMTDWRRAHAFPPPTPDAVMGQALFGSANEKMNALMNGSIGHSGNADVDFAQLMIPHSQGAVDIANVELKYGVDPDMKALAQTIVTAQTATIADLTAWRKATGR